MDTDTADPANRRQRALHYNSGFLTHRRVRRILTLAGYDLRLGHPLRRPAAAEAVLVWGHSPRAGRGEAAAAAAGAPLIRVEDAFLRSLHPGRTGDPPLGLVIDRSGIHFDAHRPSDLEALLAHHPLDDTVLLDRARAAISRMAETHLTKYSAVDPDLTPPPPGYVLLIDQTRGDASIKGGQANADSFAEMLAWAQQDHPGAPVVIKSHPETQAGHREGHFSAAALPPGVTLETRPISPWVLFEGARAVYTVSSQLGFEAILSGHRPVTFGVPFYAGWNLTDDRRPIPARRARKLTRAQLTAAALILYPTWYDPYRDALCPLEDALNTLEAQAEAWRRDRTGYVAVGMRAWKRPHLRQAFAGQGGQLRFEADATRAAEDGRPVMVWANQETRLLREACLRHNRPLWRIEDGFLRSRGLGAALVPPLSQVMDDTGIYYDPTRPSRLEALIAAAARRDRGQLARAEALIARLKRTGASKYNLRRATADLPQAAVGRTVLLVPGQVEDDAAVTLGAGTIRTNLGLLETARAAYPEAFVIYKPHPDVEAGLRPGAVAPADAAAFTDWIADESDPIALIARADRVVTMSSGLGFEALIRGVAVTTLGAPFYAGWGLTEDRGDIPARRQARPSLAALVHATLIAYPRYTDPVTGTPCPVEVALDRLEDGAPMQRPPHLSALSWLQARLSGQSWIWRR